MAPKRSSLDVVLVALVPLPVIYVLSVGPVVRFLDWLPIDPNLVVSAYRPLFWSAKHSTVVSQAMEWYLARWGVM